MASSILSKKTFNLANLNNRIIFINLINLTILKSESVYVYLDAFYEFLTVVSSVSSSDIPVDALIIESYGKDAAKSIQNHNFI